MKKTLWIELLHTIRKTKVTFIAIILFVMMGVALFFGIAWSSDAIQKSSANYFSKGQLADLDLQYVYGFEDSFVDELGEKDNVKSAEGYYQGYELFQKDGKTYQVRITSLTEDSNKAVKLEGTLPKVLGEIAVEGNWAKEQGISIGDKIVFTHDDNSETDMLPMIVHMDEKDLTYLMEAEDIAQAYYDGMKYLKTDTFTVTGLIETAPYLSRYSDMYGLSFPDALPVSCLMFTSKESFNTAAFPGYTNVAVLMDSENEKDYFSDKYASETEELTDALTPFVNKYTEDKYGKIKENIKMLGAIGMEVPDEIGDYSCDIISAKNNPSIIALDMMDGIFGKLRYSMAGLFVIIGLLVCFFTVSRIVYESSTLIGTKKAIGFTDGEVMSIYLVYAGVAALLGSIIGALSAEYIVEPILLVSIKDVYMFDKIVYFFDPIPAILFGIFEIAMQMLAVFVACRKLFKKDPLSLLTGDESSNSKHRIYEKTKLWKKMSLFSKTIANNFFTNKRRVLSTIVGVAACSSLVVCALTLNNHILSSFDRQYESVYNFDAIAYHDTTSDLSKMEKVFEKNDIPYTDVYFTHVALETPDNKVISTYLFVAEKEDYEKIIRIRDYTNGTEYDGGFWSSCSYSSYFGTQAGDKIKFIDENKTTHEIESKGFFEYFLINNLIITDTESYAKEFGTECSPNTYFITASGMDFNKLYDELSECEGFLFLSNDYEVSKLSFDAFADIFSIIVMVYLILAVAMALLVLLNLFIMFVSEKKRELLTMLVNGYGMGAAKRYIWLDTLVLAVFGIIFGILFGTVMADISLSAYNNETIYFLSGFDLQACEIGVAVSAFLTVGTTLIALRKISKFDLTDVNS